MEQKKKKKKASWTIPRVPIDSTPSACLEPSTLHLPCPISTAGYHFFSGRFIAVAHSLSYESARRHQSDHTTFLQTSSYRHPTPGAMPRLLRMTVKPLSDPPLPPRPGFLSWSSLVHTELRSGPLTPRSVSLSRTRCLLFLDHRLPQSLISLPSWITPVGAFRVSLVLISHKKPS